MSATQSGGVLKHAVISVAHGCNHAVHALRNLHDGLPHQTCFAKAGKPVFEPLLAWLVPWLTAGVSTLQECLQAVIKGPAAWDGLEIITSLPAARRISSDAIAGLLKEAITDRVPSIAPLLQLPEARLLGAKFALEMLPKAVVAGLGRVAVELGR